MAVRLKRDDFGSGGRGRFPRVRVTADASGMVWLYVWHNAHEYKTGYPHGMYIAASAAAKLSKALRQAVPRAKQQHAARLKRGQRHDQRHAVPDPNCRLCKVKGWSKERTAPEQQIEPVETAVQMAERLVTIEPTSSSYGENEKSLVTAAGSWAHVVDASAAESAAVGYRRAIKGAIIARDVAWRAAVAGKDVTDGK